ncbi:nucleoside hydrolase [Georgenia sp. SYP-B2076]|uniref:nucleoside hydrolase n=1 Tax=Georgenia sp. SYP-B2076 TaxID=2495881 RepID=UPI00197A9207|nr:nucleoside hydrolase [Georgenia sp. SYP-B2076]
MAVILDCDTGIDDALAILYAAGNGADLTACTVTHGNVPVEIGTRNTLTILDRLGLTHVPVHQGAARPIAQPLATAELVHGQDGLGDTGIAASTRAAAGTLAAAEIVRLARDRPGELTLVAVGPLTNVALALLLEPALPALLAGVVVMGGAVGVPGNASELGEANVWHDPEAAQLVIDAPWDVVFVGLEITMRTQLPAPAIERIAASADPRARLAWSLMQHYLDVYEPILGARTCVLHDPLAMALALDPDLATYRLVAASVELRGARTRGQLVGDLRGYDPAPADPRAPGVIRIVDTLDIPAFHAKFLAALGA